MKRCKYRPYLGKYSRLVIDWRWDPVRQMWNNCGCVPWRGLEARGSASTRRAEPHHLTGGPGAAGGRQPASRSEAPMDAGGSPVSLASIT